MSHDCQNAHNALCKGNSGKVVWRRSSEKLSAVPLSNNTIRRRVDDMAEDIILQVIEEVKSSPVKFCLQLDKSTDIASCEVLLGYIRYVNCNMIKKRISSVRKSYHDDEG